MKNKEVTENDFRIEEFKDKKTEDYEFRDDGKIVKKSRWKDGIISIACILGCSRSFEIDDIVNNIQKMYNIQEKLDTEDCVEIITEKVDENSYVTYYLTDSEDAFNKLTSNFDSLNIEYEHDKEWVTPNKTFLYCIRVFSVSSY